MDEPLDVVLNPAVFTSDKEEHIKGDQEAPEPPHIKDQEDCGGSESDMSESCDEDDEDDGGSSEPSGFGSTDEEYYQNKMDPFEDREESPPPATRSPPAKRSLRAQLYPRPSWKTDKDPDTAPSVT